MFPFQAVLSMQDPFCTELGRESLLLLPTHPPLSFSPLPPSMHSRCKGLHLAPPSSPMAAARGWTLPSSSLQGCQLQSQCMLHEHGIQDVLQIGEDQWAVSCDIWSPCAPYPSPVRSSVVRSAVDLAVAAPPRCVSLTTRRERGARPDSGVDRLYYGKEENLATPPKPFSTSSH